MNTQRTTVIDPARVSYAALHAAAEHEMAVCLRAEKRFNRKMLAARDTKKRLDCPFCGKQIFEPNELLRAPVEYGTVDGEAFYIHVATTTKTTTTTVLECSFWKRDDEVFESWIRRKEYRFIPGRRNLEGDRMLGDATIEKPHDAPWPKQTAGRFPVGKKMVVCAGSCDDKEDVFEEISNETYLAVLGGIPIPNRFRPEYPTDPRKKFMK